MKLGNNNFHRFSHGGHRYVTFRESDTPRVNTLRLTSDGLYLIGQLDIEAIRLRIKGIPTYFGGASMQDTLHQLYKENGYYK